MSLLMTVFFENGFSETYFPNIDNRNFPIAIRPFVSGLKEELVLNVQVWDGHWTLGGSPQYSLILKGDSVESADLEDGTVIEGMVTKTDLYFSVKIDQVQKENVSFGKYMLKEDSIFKLEIGSDDLCNIVYKNRFVTGSHAEITFESGAAYITDKNSVNGTFLNGKLVKEKTRLHYGDIIYIVGLKIVYLNNLLAINKPDGQCKIRELKAVEIPHFEEESTEEAEMETVYFLRTPRKMLNLDRETISIEKCPKKQQQKRQPLIFTIGPSFTMVIPIALAAAMTSDGFGAGSICMSLGAAGIGAVWAVVNSAYNKKEEQESESNRVSKYLEYMVRVEEKLKNKAEYNHLVLAEQYPSSGELLKFTTSNTRRLWEKSSTHEDFLSLRLGTGDRPSPNEIEGIKEELGGEHDPLNDQMEELQEKFKTLHQVPVAVSLYDYRLLGVVSGDEEKRNQLMRLLSLQIAALHPYTDVRMCYVFPGRDLEKMEYVRWLPTRSLRTESSA
ncbi:MAG: FHA domain-containing protein [Enterocloster sp.]